MKLLNKEQENFLLNHYLGITNKELTYFINNKFGTNFSVKQIKGYKQRRHLNSGLTGYFEKGHESFNKGKKWDDYLSKESQQRCSKTCFKKGNVPFNHRPVNSERINIDGYCEIKIKEPNVWVLKHRYIYENEKGKIPKGYKVIFADGNKRNFNIDNLILVSNKVELIMNRSKLIYKNKELTKVGVNIAKLKSKIYEKQKK